VQRGKKERKYEITESEIGWPVSRDDVEGGVCNGSIVEEGMVTDESQFEVGYRLRLRLRDCKEVDKSGAT
jgi:hypothetical protein